MYPTSPITLCGLRWRIFGNWELHVAKAEGLACIRGKLRNYRTYPINESLIFSELSEHEREP